ncbi:hypothetical protein [Paenibacillus thiaminolyticus]|uniref:hypothetical protein n=1 Tax=Paenibacillus thiaminolyticus TaxID=49283 RepID=UPI000DFDA8CA|nr:hypothetical protein [Paenibacillus thiaminolyticus]SUA96334.1 Uncharacterised protein [Paenibacillus thiaminolyticus]
MNIELSIDWSLLFLLIGMCGLLAGYFLSAQLEAPCLQAYRSARISVPAPPEGETAVHPLLAGLRRIRSKIPRRSGKDPG